MFNVDHRQVLHAVLVFFQIIEEHANNAHDFFFVEVVQDFGNQLNDV